MGLAAGGGGGGRVFLRRLGRGQQEKQAAAATNNRSNNQQQQQQAEECPLSKQQAASSSIAASMHQPASRSNLNVNCRTFSVVFTALPTTSAFFTSLFQYFSPPNTQPLRPSPSSAAGGSIMVRMMTTHATLRVQAVE